MTDELKRKFEQLVADAPPPSGVPSEGVLDRVRTVKRRRTATAGILATAAVVAAAIAAGNLAHLNSAPAPITNTPAPTPSVTPSSAPTSTGPGKTIGASINTLPPVENTDNPPADPPSRQPTPDPKTSTPGNNNPLGVTIKLQTKVTGSTATVTATISGTVLSPLVGPDHKEVPVGTRLVDRSGRVRYQWGDGTESEGSDGGVLDCKTKTRYTGKDTYNLGSHTFTKPGTYQLAFGIYFCKSNGGYDSYGQDATIVIH
jgi:hypothetical protein